MSDTVLSATLHAIATEIGDRLPAAFGLDASEVLIASDASAHPMPADAVTVRWPLGDDEAVLVVAVSAEAATMLQAGPPESSLGEALTPRVAPVLPLLADLLGVQPALGAAEEVAADEALAAGPGDAVSIRLEDAGVHRATIALRMVIPDALVQPLGGPQDWDELKDVDGQPDPGSQPVIGPVGSAIPNIGSDPTGAHQLYAAGQPQGQAGRPRRKAYHDPMGAPQGDAHPAEFAAFDHLHSFPGAGHSMAMLGDVEMGVTAELGRTKLTVRDVLGLNQGSIIELDRAAGSPVDVVVNGTLIARGEVVVIDEEFGIRITEIVGMNEDASPAASPLNLPLAQ